MTLSEETRGQSKPCIALCFFGITRSLKYTHSSIQKNVIEPLQNRGDLRIYGHFFRQERIENPRSGEFGQIDQDDHRFLRFDAIAFDDPSIPEVVDLFEKASAYGAGWNNDFHSLRNLCQQLVSLDKVFSLAKVSEVEIFVFARPDLMYHDNLEDVISRAQSGPSDTVYLPNWQDKPGSWYRNDRFAVIKGQEAAQKYATRLSRAIEYCETFKEPLPAEILLGFALEGTSIQNMGHRATRVRMDGTYKRESFDLPRVRETITRVRKKHSNKHVRDVLIFALRFWQALTYRPRYLGLGYRVLNGVARTKKAQNARSIVKNKQA